MCFYTNTSVFWEFPDIIIVEEGVSQPLYMTLLHGSTPASHAAIPRVYNHCTTELSIMVGGVAILMNKAGNIVLPFTSVASYISVSY